MAVIALCSATGSPGVTTTTVGLATVWPRPVLLIEADPSGSNGLLAGFLRGAREYESGLLELASSPLPVADALRDVVRPIEGTTVSYLVGVQSPAQAGGLHDLWAPLAEALADLERGGQDVLIDAGRLGLTGSPDHLLAWADLTLLVTRTTLPALAGARPRAEDLRAPAGQWRQPGLMLIGEGQPYRAKEVTRALGLPVVASIVDDPAGAAVYHRGATPPRRFSSDPLSRSLHAAVAAMTTAVARHRDELTSDVTGTTGPKSMGGAA
ncbi:hypothetical protein ACFQ8T_04455 [Isoptericola sp. NPDC056618]|uniref:hypothetical protein n=1 Tax=Isoptericola sp. NPDC056618 TaxID=3345878 RepID=UPI0036744DF8